MHSGHWQGKAEGLVLVPSIHAAIPQLRYDVLVAEMKSRPVLLEAARWCFDRLARRIKWIRRRIRSTNTGE